MPFLRRYGWILIVVTWVVALTGLAWYATRYLPLSWHAAGFEPEIRQGYPFQAWDANYYLQIARIGYTSIMDAPFFPAYAFLIRIAHTLFPISWEWLAAGISVVSFILAIGVTRSLGLVEKLGLRKWIVPLMLSIPTGFVFIAPYSEVLWLLATAGVIWALERDRFWLASVSAAVGALARPFGIILLIPLVVHLLQRKRWGQAIAATAMTVIPVTLWIVSVSSKVGVAFAPFQSQMVEYQRWLGFDWRDFLAHAQGLFVAQNPGYKIISLTLIAGLAFALTGLIGLAKHFSRTWLITGVIFVLIIYGSGPINSTHRHVFSFLPLILGAASLLRFELRASAIGFGAGLLILNTALFGLRFFVF